MNGRGHFLSRLEASIPLSVWCSISWEPGQTHYPLRKPLHAVSSYSPALSLLSLFLFSLRKLKARLCVLLACCLFGFLVWDRLSWEALTDSRAVISLLQRSQPTAWLRTTACLSRTAQHTQETLLTALFWSQSNRKSMEGGFLFFLRDGGRAEKFHLKPCKLFF